MLSNYKESTKIPIFIIYFILLGSCFSTSLNAKNTSPINYLELRSQYCKQDSVKSCSEIGIPCNKDNTKVDQGFTHISNLNITLACQNYYNENHCEEVKESIGQNHQAVMMSCLPNDICNDEKSLNILQCTIDGVAMQFEIPNLAFSVGVAAGLGAIGASGSLATLLTTPLLVYSEGKRAEACHADIKFKKMAVRIHNLSLFEDERPLDIEGKNKDILKMKCADLNSFLNHRLEVMVAKRQEASRWSMTPKPRQLSVSARSLLASLRSNRCFSTSVGHQELCKTIASLTTGVAVGALAGAAGSLAPRLIKSSKKTNPVAVEENQNSVLAIQKNYADLLVNIEGSTSEIVAEIALLESKGVSREVIRNKIQTALKKPNVCTTR